MPEQPPELARPPRIRMLDEATIHRIASGEVIERPASVVKELVENSLDAGAKRIDITIQGEMPLGISVSDDGEGMCPEDVELAVRRHATSKITSADDIQHVGTLGFRGEALASIAAVSRLTIRTRTRDAPEGTLLRATAGKVEEVGRAGSPFGTSVAVSDLFFCTPARFKFLKSPSLERARITETVIRLAISHPHVSFVLRFGKNRAMATGGDGEMTSVLAGLWGADFVRRLIPVKGAGPGTSIEGLVGPADLARGDRSRQCFVVNRRVVESRVIASAVAAAFQGLLPRGRYAVAVLVVSCPPEVCDVNVHPAKLEVKFADEAGLFTVVRTAVARALAHSETASLYGAASSRETEVVAAARTAGGETAARTERVQQPSWSEAVVREGTKTAPGWRFLGAFGGTFLAFEDEAGGLAIVDQHAAHERVLFEDLEVATTGRVQHLLVPRVIQVSHAAGARLESGAMDLLRDLGVGLESFGSGAYPTFRLLFVPEWAADRPDAFSAESVEAVLTDDRMGGVDARTQLRAALACRSAVRDGDTLDAPRSEALLRDLFACRSPGTCPHGRPTVYRVSRSELWRAFRRGS